MINLVRIAWRFLIGRHSSGLISFSFYLSIIGLAIGTASLLLISSFSNGFSEKVQSKLSTIDGEIRIEKYSSNSNSYISDSEIEELNNILSQFPEIESISPYSQTQGMLQSGQKSDGTLIFGITKSLLNDLTSQSFLKLLNESFTENKIILGSKLADNLNLELGMEVNIFDLTLLTNSQQIKGVKMRVIGLIETGFSEYDKMISFIPDITYQEFYETENFSTGLILNVNSPSISNFTDRLRSELNFPFLVNSWEERHSVLLQWIEIYHIPIQLVMGFITLLAIFNISSTLWMISLDKIGNIGILKAIGYTRFQVRNIFIFKGIIIGLIGISLGSIFAFFVYVFQNKYHIISLSSDVYFLDYLPILPNYFEVLIILSGILISTILFSIIPANNIKNVIPAQVLKDN